MRLTRFVTVLAVLTATILGCGESADRTADSEAAQAIQEICRDSLPTIRHEIARPPRNFDPYTVAAWAGLLSDNFKRLITEIKEVPVPDESALDTYRITDSLDEVESHFGLIESSIKNADVVGQRLSFNIVKRSINELDATMAKQAQEAADLGLKDCAVRPSAA